MKPPIFVRELSEKERQRLEAGLRSNKDAFVMRRCQILLASARGLSPPRTVSPEDCRKPRMCLANGEECHPSLQRARTGRPRRRLLAPQARPRRFRWKECRGFKGDAPPLSEGVRARLEPVDFGDGRRGGLRGGLRGGAHRRARLRRDDWGDAFAPPLGSVDANAKRWITSLDPLYERKKGGATG